MEKGRNIEKALYVVMILAEIATILATIFDFKTKGSMISSSIASLIFFITYGLYSYTKRKNQKNS